MSGLFDAVRRGDLGNVQRLVAEGADVKKTDSNGLTPLLQAAKYGYISIMSWLLAEGGSSIAEKTNSGTTALIIAASLGRFPAVQYLLEGQGALITEIDSRGNTVWKGLSRIIGRMVWKEISSIGLAALLEVMVMLEDAPNAFIVISNLPPQYADICTRGRQLRAQLPSYLEQQRAAVVAHCPLPAVLGSLIAEYGTTTPEDMWADGLRVQAPGVKRRRSEGED
jgi:hypothetical protein